VHLRGRFSAIHPSDACGLHGVGGDAGRNQAMDSQRSSPGGGKAAAHRNDKRSSPGSVVATAAGAGAADRGEQQRIHVQQRAAAGNRLTDSVGARAADDDASR
jgi:hypothetical protein